MARKGRLFNTTDNFYNHKETVANNQLNNKMMTKPNPIFDAVIHHMQPHDIIHNATNQIPKRYSHTDHGSTHPPPVITTPHSARTPKISSGDI
jgi:hypothetical protein